MKQRPKQPAESKIFSKYSSKKAPFKRGNFEKKQKFYPVTPALHTMTHDFLFRNVYKKPKPLSDEKRNHPTSHYRYKFYAKPKPKAKRKEPVKPKKHDIPFYDDMKLNIAPSSNELSYEHFRKDVLKRKYLKHKLVAQSKWLQSKIREDAHLEHGGLDLQGQVPERGTIGKEKFVLDHALVLATVRSVTEHCVRLLLYGSIPATLTIREVSDVLSHEIDHLTTRPATVEIAKPANTLLDIQKSMEPNALVSRQSAKRTFFYKSFEEVPTCIDMFTTHQIIRCMVTHRNKHGLRVSLRPSLFNAKLRMNDLIVGYCLLCSVQSIEDKGYVIDTGIYVQDKGGVNEIAVRAFMGYEDVPLAMLKRIMYRRKTKKLPIGFPLDLVVKKSDPTSHAVWLTLEFRKYYRELTSLPIVPIAALKPGFCVQCNVKSILKDGLVVEFGKVYQGVVSYSHMDKLVDVHWKQAYEVGQEIRARIVLVHPERNAIQLSIKPHLTLQSDEQLLPRGMDYQYNVPRRCGEIIKADVRRIAYDSLYLYSKLLDPEWLNKEEVTGDEETERKLFPAKNVNPLLQMIPIRVHQRHLEGSLYADDAIAKWKDRRNLQVKLIWFDSLTGEFSGTLKQSEVTSQVLFYKDIRYGMIFNCTVTSMDKKNDIIKVTFCNGLTGQIPLLHCSELPPKSLDEPRIAAKYKIGARVKCRVLVRMRWKKLVSLTAKPSLISGASDPITISSWNTPKNTISAGIIHKMNDVVGYIVVHFYNSITAIITKANLRHNGYFQVPSKEFYIGQVVQVRVIKSVPRQKRMVCSLNLNTVAKEPYTERLFWTKIVSKKNGCFIVKTLTNYDPNKSQPDDDSDGDTADDDGNAFQELKLYSVLPFDHLSDAGQRSVDLVRCKAFDIGDKIQVLTLHRIDVNEPNIEKQFELQSKVSKNLGLSDEVFQFGDNKILRIVTAKTGLLQLQKKGSLRTLCPDNTREMKVGDELLGYICSLGGTRQRKHKVWLHFGGILQLPVKYWSMHDLPEKLVQKCIDTSFSKPGMYNSGDLVMAKVVGVTNKDGADDERDGHWFTQMVTLSMKPSVLLPTVTASQKAFYGNSFMNEWYLTHQQRQALYARGTDEKAKAVLESLQFGMVLACTVKKVHKTQVMVEFVPSMEGVVNGVIKLHGVEERKDFQRRLAKKEQFKCNVLDIEWDGAGGDVPVVELYDAVEVPLCTISTATNTVVIAENRLIESAQIIYVCTTYLLCQFFVNLDDNMAYIGIVPMKLPYLLVPTVNMFAVYDEIDINVISSSHDYDGIILCGITNDCASKYIRDYSRKYVKEQYKKQEQRDMALSAKRAKRKLIEKKSDSPIAVKKRKITEIGGDSPIAVKKRKIVEIGGAESLIAAKKTKIEIGGIAVEKWYISAESEIADKLKVNVMSSIYSATLISCDVEKREFVINAKHETLPDIDGGILPFEQLCDNYKTGRKLCELYQPNKEKIEIKVVVTNVEGNVTFFTAKNMFVRHCEVRTYQIWRTNKRIKPNVPVIGYISEHNDNKLSIYHGDNLISHVSNDNCLLLPFDYTEIRSVYKCGQSVIAQFNKWPEVSLNNLDTKYIQNMDMIKTNQSFINEYKKIMDMQCEVHIGDVIDVLLSNITATVIEFTYNTFKGEIIRPEHSGMDAFLQQEEATKVLVLDIDYDTHTIFGSIRLCNKSPKILTESEQEMEIKASEDMLCTLEWISVCNGYLLLQVIESYRFIIVPFATPYFHFTFNQIYNLFFQLGGKYQVRIIEYISSMSVYLGFIPEFINIVKKMQTNVVNNPSKYKPYDLRFSHPAKIMYTKEVIRGLSVKLIQSTEQGHIAEFAPGFYPKIVIQRLLNENEQQKEKYLILEDKAECNAMVKVNINLLKLIKDKKYSNSNREIIISIDDVLSEEDYDEIMQETKRDIIESLKVGTIVDVEVASVSKHGIDVSLLDTVQKGFVEAIHSSDSIAKIENLISKPQDMEAMVGEQCKAVIIDISNQNMLQLSLEKSVLKKYQKIQHLLPENKKKLRLDVGQEINGIITKIVAGFGLFLDLGVFGIGQIHITNCVKNVNDFQRINLNKIFKVNEILTTRTIAINDDLVELSIKHLFHPNYVSPALNYNDITIGSLMRGIVTMIDASLGVIVWLSRHIKGNIPLKQCKVSSFNDAVHKYPIGTIINNINVLSASPKHRRVELSLSHNKNEKKFNFYSYKLSELDVGDFITCIFQKQLDNKSLLVNVPRSDFRSGIMRKSEISSDLLKNDNIKKMIKGDKIQCWVLKIEGKKVYFSMKYKSLQINKSHSDFSKQQIKEIRLEKRKRTGVSMMRQYKKLQKEMADNESEEEDGIKPLEIINYDLTANTNTKPKSMEIDAEESDIDEECEDIAMAPQKEEKKEVIQEMRESNVEWNELMQSEGFNKSPNTTKEFEKLLVCSPNSSIIYIEYIAFYLKKKSMIKARQIIERALKNIDLCLEKERLNIWIAWMNLEILYGSTESLIKVFQRGLKHNDRKDMFLEFLSICQQNGKLELCGKYFTKMLHEFKSDTAVYINYGAFLYHQKEIEKARDLLKRGIQNLPNKSQHISLIQKFAWNELKYVRNQSEGENMFRGLLRKHKNNANIWKAYAFAVYRPKHKADSLQNARSIFEKALSAQNKMKMQDTKWLFKQYLNFENKYGHKSSDHKENVQHIKQLAKNYVTSIKQGK